MAILFLLLKREEIITPPTKPAPVSTPATSTAPAPTTTQVAPVDLSAAFATADKSLPRKAQVALLEGEEVHHMREMNNELGKAVGELAEEANQKPERREKTLQFFLRCAEDAEIINSARALCWWKLTNKINEWKVFIPLSEAKVPMDIQRLAASINPDREK